VVFPVSVLREKKFALIAPIEKNFLNLQHSP